MKLLIDIGNTQIKAVFSEQGKLAKINCLPFEDLALWLKTEATGTNEVIFANVAAEQLSNIIKMWALTEQITFTQVQSEPEVFGVRCGYQAPAQLGIDRWLGILGAAQLFPGQNILLVDSGTATTVDMLDKNGQHQGGWILPGYEAMYQAVVNSTTKVMAAFNYQGETDFGNNTTDNVNHGCWAALVGAVELAVKKCQQQWPVDKVVLAGGNGRSLQQLLGADSIYIDDIIFQGLLRYSRDN